MHLTFPVNSCSNAFSANRLSPWINILSKNVMLTHPVRRMVRLLRVFDENPRLQPWPVAFPNPSEFEFCVLTQRCVPLVISFALFEFCVERFHARFGGVETSATTC